MTYQELIENFYYDGSNLRYKRHRHGLPKDCIGKIAGYVDTKGYRILKFKQKAYKAHRLVWLYAHKEWPKQSIDHINRDKLDNRIENLRDCDHSTNMRNLGDVGVIPFRDKYKARLGQKHIGHYDTYAEALAARKEAEAKYW